MHSEYNASSKDPVHFLQIWIQPRRPRLPPSYEQKFFSADEKRGRLLLIASPDGADGSVRVQQDVRLFSTLLESGQTVSHEFAKGFSGWLHVAKGTAEVNGIRLKTGDGVAVDGEARIAITSRDQGEVLLFELGA